VEDLIMRRVIAVLLLILMSSIPAAAEKAHKESKASKSKDKRFESVAVQLSTITGSYRGPAESYGLILEAAPNGVLHGNYVEMGRVAVLDTIRLEGAEFTARANFDDGSTRTITGSFAKRTMNGETAFGLRMRDVPVEGFGAIDTFFERF
jgi:hypothetical protein